MAKYEIRNEINEVLNEQNENSDAPWNHLDEVYPGIYIGDEVTATDIETLKQLGIAHIVNVAFVKSRTHFFNYTGTVHTDEDWYTDRNFQCNFLGLEAIDNPSFNLSQYFQEAVDFIEEALKNDGKVLVHCYVGMSRSATIVIVYLMLKKNMRAKDAIVLIRKSRQVYPNSGFLDSIVDLDIQLRGGGGGSRPKR